MTILDATKLRDPQNADEALAIGLRLGEQGDVISFHTEWCRTHLDAANECTCTPRTMTIGAEA